MVKVQAYKLGHHVRSWAIGSWDKHKGKNVTSDRLHRQPVELKRTGDRNKSGSLSDYIWRPMDLFRRSVVGAKAIARVLFLCFLCDYQFQQQ